MDILYSCTPEGGELGEPSRRIEISGMDHELLEGAYLLSRSDFFGDPDLPERNLCLILQAEVSLLSQYDQYNIERLRLFGDAEDNCSPDRGQWEIQIPVVGWSNEEVDAKIAEILQWHIDEIDRIANLPNE